MTKTFLDLILEHSLVRPEEIVGNMVFPGRTTPFRCIYPRVVNVNDQYTVVDEPNPDPFELIGFLRYDITITTAGGRTSADITAEHGLPNLHAK